MRRALLVATAGLVFAGAGFAATLAAVHLTASVPAPALALRVPGSFTIASGTPPVITVPPQGSLALDADPGGRLAEQGPELVRPIASVAKAMTALVVLRAHPLDRGAEGPVLTMTDADVALYRTVFAQGGSAVPVAAGERLTEREVLLALLLPSANNLALTLGRWVAGSDAAFVQQLNAQAIALGMRQTHFADPSGFDPATVSTAADLVRLGRAVLAVPALADIVATRQATLPDGTQLRNLDTLLDTEPGWLGIKTGDSDAAGGCLLFAARRPPSGSSGPPVEVVGAVLGQPDRAAALAAARDAVSTALAGYVTVDLRGLTPPLSGELTSRWGDSATIRPALAARSGVLTVRTGTALALRTVSEDVHAPVPAGHEVAHVEATFGSTLVRWPVVTAADLPGPSFFWRLLHG